MMTSLDGLLPIMSHDPLVTWLCEIRSSPAGGGSAHKRLIHHQLLVLVFFLFLFLLLGRILSGLAIIFLHLLLLLTHVNWH